MHEFGIAQGLLETVLDKVRENGAKRIDVIRLEIGVLAGVEQEALEFAFQALAEGSPAQHAQLVIDKIPLRCYCDPCDMTFECKPFAYRCPNCGKTSIQVRSGKEMNLLAMEVS